MCGIVAVVRRPTDRTPPSLSELAAELRRATGHLDEAFRAGPPAGPLAEASAHVEAVDAALRGVPGVRALIDDPAGVGRPRPPSSRRSRTCSPGSKPASTPTARWTPTSSRRSTPRWSGRRTRCGRWPGTGSAPVARSRRSPPAPSRRRRSRGSPRCRSRFSAIDRLEVPGPRLRRAPPLRPGPRPGPREAETSRRCASAADPLFRSGAVRTPDGALSFVYKAAAEIGELGDNVARCAARSPNDPLLHRALDNATRASWCSATRAGRASGSSPKRTRTR